MLLMDDQEKVISFFKEAFCVDGEVKCVDGIFISKIGAIELNDSKRGKFFITSVEKVSEGETGK